jgi:hypothetical protein
MVVLAIAGSVAFPGAAEACRIARPQPPLTAVELERNANEGLVRNADAIALAEVTFRTETILRGVFPPAVRTGGEIISSTCGPYGNNGSYPGGAVGDRVILFLLQGIPIHAERLDTPRAAGLLSIIHRENP